MLKLSDDMPVDLAAEMLRERGFKIEKVVFRRGEYVAVIVRPGEAPVLGVEGCGHTIGDAIMACLDSWQEWRGDAGGA